MWNIKSISPISRDRRPFMELESFIRKPPQICISIVICAIKNSVLKKTASKTDFAFRN